jgi:hypothetical protein
MLTLSLPDGSGILVAHAFWIEKESERIRSRRDVKRLFHRTRNVKRTSPIDTPGFQFGLAGEAADKPPGIPFWKRLFQKPAWRRFRWWSFERERLGVVLTFLYGPQADAETDVVLNMVAQSLELAETPADPPDVFAGRVLRFIRDKYPELKCAPDAEFQLKVGESQLNLFNFYRSYVNTPDQFESIIERGLDTIVQAQNLKDDRPSPSLEEVRDRIMPMLYPSDVWENRLNEFAGRKWVGGLAVLFVVDEEQSYWFLREDKTQDWGLTTDELFALSIRNLDRYFDNSPMQFTLAGSETGPRVLIPARADAYNSSRLLSEKFHGDLRSVLSGQFAVGLPSRDFFVAVNLETDEVVDHVRQRVREDFKQMDHPLSDRLLLVTHDGVTEYQPWDA